MTALYRLSAIAFASVFLLMTGCVFIDGDHVDTDEWEILQKDNRTAISNLPLGISRQAVLDQLGAPADSEAFTHEGTEIRVLFYRTTRKHADGETSRDETTPLIFQNDKLTGWGEKVYQNLR